MRIHVKAKTKAKNESVERMDQPTLGLDGKDVAIPSYKVSVKEAPEHGKANEAIIRLLSEHFDIPRSGVKLISGQSSKQKVFEIEK